MGDVPVGMSPGVRGNQIYCEGKSCVRAVYSLIDDEMQPWAAYPYGIRNSENKKFNGTNQRHFFNRRQQCLGI